MEANENKPKSELLPFKAPSKEMGIYYANLYERNQSKWMRRSSLEPEHIGSVFEYEDKKLTLVGTVDPILMLVKDESDKYYKMNCNLVSELVTGKR